MRRRNARSSVWLSRAASKLAAVNDHVELARDHRQANDDDDGRQKNDGEKNAACHRWPPAVLHCRAS